MANLSRTNNFTRCRYVAEAFSAISELLSEFAGAGQICTNWLLYLGHRQCQTHRSTLDGTIYVRVLSAMPV